MKTILFYLIAVLLATVNGAPSCDSGWVTYKDELCIKLFTTLETHEDAKTFCASQGSEISKASLVMIKESGLQELLSNYTVGVFDYIWLGGKYDNQTANFTWEDGDSLTYINWQEGYPHNVTEDSDSCMELRPSETKMAVNGKWANERCQKRNLVMCQKTLSWSLEDAVTELIRVRKEYEEKFEEIEEQFEKEKEKFEEMEEQFEKEKEKFEEMEEQFEIEKEKLAEMSKRVVPVGSIYVEYYNQPSPRTLWPNLTWQDISSTYAGLFFRTYGGDSGGWGTTQSACAPRITKVAFHLEWGQGETDLPEGNWSENAGVGDNSGNKHHESISFYTESCEVRPKNQAIRIWKRTS